MNNFLRGFGNFKKNENGITEYVDYLGTKYTFDPTTKKWKSNGRILTENYLQDLELSQQEGVGDAADDSGGGKKRSTPQEQEQDLILLFDYNPGGLFWNQIQESSFGAEYGNETYYANSAFYEEGTAPDSFSLGGANEGWRKKIPNYFYNYRSIPKPLVHVNLGQILYLPRFYSFDALEGNYVDLPAGHTGGYYRIGVTSVNTFATEGVSEPEAYLVGGVQNYLNFDSTGRSVSVEVINGDNVLYYDGLTGPIPVDGEGITGFYSTTVWPTRNTRSLIPVHDIVNIGTFIVASIRSFYKNNIDYPEPDFDSETSIDHYISLGVGYVNPFTSIIDAIDLYVSIYPGYASSSTDPSSIIFGVNNNFVNRYDAICAVNEINRLLNHFKQINDGTARSNEIKNAILSLLQSSILPNYSSNDPASIIEYAELQNILNNLHKFKFSFYNTIPTIYAPPYATTCSSNLTNIQLSNGTGANCSTSIVGGVNNFYSVAPFIQNNIIYPFFNQAGVFSFYTSNNISLNLDNKLSILYTPYKNRGSCPNFSTYVSIMQSKLSRSFIISNNTNGLLKNVDWVYYLAEDSEIHASDDERSSFNYFNTLVNKKITNYYRNDNIPLISFTLPFTVISSGNVIDLASNGSVFIPPDLIKKRVITPCNDAGINGFGIQQGFDNQIVSFLNYFDQMNYNYSNGTTPDLSVGLRYYANSYLSYYFGKYTSIPGSSYIAPPGYDIRFLNSGIQGDIGSVSNISGTTYALLISSGDTGDNWTSYFPSERGFTPGQFFSQLRGVCYEHLFEGDYFAQIDSKFQNNISRRQTIKNILNINEEWFKQYFENSLIAWYGLTGTIDAPVTSAIVGIDDYTGMPASITSALDYEVWGANFTGDMFSVSNPVQYRYGNASYSVHSIVPTIVTDTGTYNGFREPTDTTASGFTTQIINNIKSKVDVVPAGRKVLNLRHWWGVDIGCYTILHDDYYKNTSDGTTYLNDRILTCWVENNSDDSAASFESFLIKCRDAGFTCDYVMSDQEAQDNFWIDGRNAYNYGINDEQYEQAQTDARRISAIVADDSFDLYEHPITQKTLAEEFMDNYHELREKNGFTFDPRTVYEILDPFTGVTGVTNYVPPSTYWQAYGCAGGCEPDGQTVGGLSHPEGYNLYFHVLPAWRSATDNWYFNVYSKQFRDTLQNVSEFENVIHLEYDVDPVNTDESRFFQLSNLEVHLQETVLNTYSGDSSYYGGPTNLIYPSWAGADPAGQSEDTPQWIGINQSRSGYILNPQNDYERYNFSGYLVDVYQGPAGNAALVRYPETYPFVNGERDDDLIAIWQKEYCFKMLVYVIKLTRHHLRSDTTHWQRFAPWVGYITWFNAKWSTGGYWHEVLRHLLVNGARLFQVFNETYIGLDSERIHNILDEWRHISGNSRAQPCTNTNGSVDELVDRVLMYEAFENVLISGGRLVNDPDQYIWRLSVAPKHFVNGICTLYRQNNDSDLPETITINYSDPEPGKREGVWIRRFTAGMPQYAVAGYNP